MATRTGEIAIAPDNPDRCDLGGIGVIWKIEGERAGDRFSVVHHPLAPRALAAPLHRHHREDEYSYVITGTLGALLGEEVVTAGPGRGSSSLASSGTRSGTQVTRRARSSRSSRPPVSRTSSAPSPSFTRLPEASIRSVFWSSAAATSSTWIPAPSPGSASASGSRIRSRETGCPRPGGGEPFGRRRVGEQRQVDRPRRIQVGQVRAGEGEMRSLERGRVAGQLERHAIGNPLPAARERRSEREGEELEH